jgi:hypothetical protein
MSGEGAAAIPSIVVDAYYKPIRESERKKFVSEIAWRRASKDESIDNFKFTKMSPVDEEKFIRLSNHEVQCYPVDDSNWCSEQVLIGDYALKSIGTDGKPEGYLTFGIVNNGDAFIIQVQGKPGRRFTPEKQNLLVQTTLEFLKEIQINRVFLINGDIINSQRKEPNPDLPKRYSDIARNNNFNQNMWKLPYIDLTVNT